MQLAQYRKYEQNLTEPAMPWQARGARLPFRGSLKTTNIHTGRQKKEKEQPPQSAPQAIPAVYGSASDEVGTKGIICVSTKCWAAFMRPFITSIGLGHTETLHAPIWHQLRGS